MGASRKAPRRLVSTLGALAIALGALPFIGVGSVAAYSGSSAAAWADAHQGWSCGVWGVCYAANCTEFASEALHYGGGYSYVGVGQSYTDDHYWWQVSTPYIGWSNSRSWSVAKDLYNFEILHAPGGFLWGKVAGTSTYQNSSLAIGDLVFYDWDSNGVIDHTAIVVGWDYDHYSGRYGQVVDTDTRYHAFWSLYDENTSRATTTIYLVHIDSRNY